MTRLGRRQRRTTIPAKHGGSLDHLLAEGALAQIVGLWVVDRGRGGLLPLALSVVGLGAWVAANLVGNRAVHVLG